MAWTVLTNSTTADADEVMDNYYYIRQGDLMPLGGANMTSTDAAYDLGSSTYAWDNGHIETLHNLTISTTRIVNAGTTDLQGNVSIGGDVVIAAGKTIALSSTGYISHSGLGVYGYEDSGARLFHVKRAATLFATGAGVASFTLTVTADRIVHMNVVWYYSTTPVVRMYQYVGRFYYTGTTLVLVDNDSDNFGPGYYDPGANGGVAIAYITYYTQLA